MKAITKQEFESLSAADITKKQYDATISRINDRFDFIMLKICPSLKRKGWFDYANVLWGNDGREGFFDPVLYKNEIELGGSELSIPAPYGDISPPYIPTRWLWEENFEQEFHLDVARYAFEEKLKKREVEEATRSKEG